MNYQLILKIANGNSNLENLKGLKNTVKYRFSKTLIEGNPFFSNIGSSFIITLHCKLRLYTATEHC